MATGRKCSRCKSTGGAFASCQVCSKNGCDLCVKDSVCNRCQKPAADHSEGFRLNGIPFSLGPQPENSPWGAHVTFAWEKAEVRQLKPVIRRPGFLTAFEKMRTR